MSLQQSSGLICQGSVPCILRPCFGCIMGCSSHSATFYSSSCTGQLTPCQTILHASQCFIHSCWLLACLSSHSLLYLQHKSLPTSHHQGMESRTEKQICVSIGVLDRSSVSIPHLEAPSLMRHTKQTRDVKKGGMSDCELHAHLERSSKMSKS